MTHTRFGRLFAGTRTTPPARGLLRVEAMEDRCVPATLFVDDDFAAPAGNKFQTIQAAVDAAKAGDTIRVNPGIYTEQVTVPDDKDRLTIESKRPLQAVIQAPDTLTGTNAVVRVQGADGVTVRGFTVTGPGPDWGVQVDDGGSATIRNNLITGIGSDLGAGAQTGVGVLVGGRAADGETPATATVSDNTIVDYQKGGIVVVNDGTAATVTKNTVVGSGPDDFVAQNGIQVAFGAAAVVTRNTVTGNIYTGTDFEAAGVFVFDAGPVVIADNKLVGNQDGILAEETSALAITGNWVLGSELDGIVLVGVTGAYVAGNKVSDSGRDGIVVEDSDANLIALNRVDGSGRYGIAVTGDSAGNVIFLNRVTDSGVAGKLDDATGPNFWFLNKLG